MHASAPPLGAILAGGASRRFGAPKELAVLHGRTLAERVRDAVLQVLADTVLITNTPEPLRFLGLRSRRDALPGAGPLSGIHAALAWAREENRAGALCVSCDAPFLSAGLLAAVLHRAGQTAAPVVMPESEGRRGIEPLCAFYSVQCLPLLEDRILHGPHELHSLLDACGGARIPLDVVREYGDPATLFCNVNTRQDFARATQWSLPQSTGSAP